jgi:hypothetical protein
MCQKAMPKLIFSNKRSDFRSQRNELGHQFSHAINHFKSKLKHFRRIEELDLELVEEQQFELFWEWFSRLLEKHNAKPVHTSKKFLQREVSE